MLPLPGEQAFISNYGEGLVRVAQPGLAAGSARQAEVDGATTPPGPATLPSAARPPTAAELGALAGQLSALPASASGGPARVVALADDWITGGDWQGRYGRYWACLCAMNSPHDYLWGAGERQVEYNLRIGPAFKADSLRYWVHWLYTDNPRSLELPSIYYHSRLLKKLTAWSNDPLKQQYRRQAEVDDHGETYPMTTAGPNVYGTLRVPPGLFTLSLYDFNKDGHSANERLRDSR